MHSEATPILHETLGTIREILGSDLDGITVERAVVGLFFTGVELSNGIAGACATPIKTIPEAVCCPSSAMAMPFPGKLRGRRAFDVAREAFSDHGIRRAVGIATDNALGQQMAAFHRKYDLLLTPMMPIPALPAGQDLNDPTTERHWIDWSPFSYPFNMTRQPAASIPCGLTRAGLPIGLQIVGPLYSDDRVLRAARAFEATQPERRPPLG